MNYRPVKHNLTEEEWQRELKYRTAVTQAKELVKEGFMSPDDFAIIDTKLREKYHPVLAVI